MKLKKARKIYAGQQNVMVSRKGKLVNIEDAPEKWDQRKVISANKDGKMQILILGKKAKKKDSESGLTDGFDQFISETEMLIGGKDGKKKKKKHDKDKDHTSTDGKPAQRMHITERAVKTSETNPTQEEKKPEQKVPARTASDGGSNIETQKRRPGRPPRNKRPETTEKASKEETIKEEDKQ